MCIIREKWWFCLALTIMATMASFWPDSLLLLRYDRSALLGGELWRIATAHLVHLNSRHLVINLSGLLLIGELLWGAFPLLDGIGLVCFSGMAISACLWWLQPDLVWYAGLSGIIHGLWAGCTIYGLQNTERGGGRVKLVYCGGALLLVAKLLWEFHFGHSEVSSQLIGARVVTESHLYGALFGAIYVLVLRAYRIVFRLRIERNS